MELQLAWYSSMWPDGHSEQHLPLQLLPLLPRLALQAHQYLQAYFWHLWSLKLQHVAWRAWWVVAVALASSSLPWLEIMSSKIKRFDQCQ